MFSKAPAAGDLEATKRYVYTASLAENQVS
jgi:hypothetical protein